MAALWEKVKGVRGLIGLELLGVIVLLAFITAGAFGQNTPAQVSYDVEFSTTGALLDMPEHCSGAGTDKLTGTITGIEPSKPGEDSVYKGMLTRVTQITTCDNARNSAGEDRICSLNIKGHAQAWFSLTLYAGKRGGYLEVIEGKPVRVIDSSVSGTCEPADMADLQKTYGSMSTAGSPASQPINVLAMPRIGPFPISFSPTPSNGRDGLSTGDKPIWTLTVTGRHP